MSTNVKINPTVKVPTYANATTRVKIEMLFAALFTLLFGDVEQPNFEYVLEYADPQCIYDAMLQTKQAVTRSRKRKTAPSVFNRKLNELTNSRLEEFLMKSDDVVAALAFNDLV